MKRTSDIRHPCLAGRRATSVVRPLIGVPTAELPGFSSQEPRMWAMRTSYIAPILAAGGLPVLLPNITSLNELEPLLNRLDGLFLAGGHDINPELYGERPSERLEQTDPARDQSEILVTRWALERTLPILAICRGMQMINIAAGGTLHQDIPNHRCRPISYTSLAHHGHPVRIEPCSRLAGIAKQPEIWINSLHHQAVASVGDGLVVTAQAPDGIVEGLEARRRHHWCVGLQGHPEALVDRADWVADLFAAYVSACRSGQPRGKCHD